MMRKRAGGHGLGGWGLGGGKGGDGMRGGIGGGDWDSAWDSVRDSVALRFAMLRCTGNSEISTHLGVGETHRN